MSNPSSRKLGIPEGKQRYSVTLTVETVDAVKADLKTLGLHPSIFSGLLDEMLSKSAPTIHLLAEKKRIGKTVFFELMARKLQF